MLFLHGKKEGSQGENREKEENDSDSNVPPWLASSDMDENESKEQKPKDEKDDQDATHSTSMF